MAREMILLSLNIGDHPIFPFFSGIILVFFQGFNDG